jgi:adenosine deaminase
MGTALLQELHMEQAAERVAYVELRISPRRFMANQAGALDQVLTGFGSAAINLQNPVVRLILVINRNWPTSLLDELGQVLASGLPSGWVGIDLAGDEVIHPDTQRFVEVFRLAELKGLGRTVHAGEFGGSDSVWSALDVLGARRIGHGVPVGRQKALQARLRQDDVLIEICLSSNTRLGITSIDDHPLRSIDRADIPFSINVDMPVLLQRTLPDEEKLAAEILSWTESDADEARSRAWSYCFFRP